MSKIVKIYMSVGDDGGGPFSFAREIVYGLAKRFHDYGLGLQLAVEGWKGERGNRHEDFLRDMKDLERRIEGFQFMEFIEREYLLKFERDKETDLVSEKTKDILKGFSNRFKTYKGRHIPDFYSYDLVLSIVDPCVIPLVKSYNENMKVVCITDHTWDVTFRRTLKKMSLLDDNIQGVLEGIGKMYKGADAIYMWPEPVTPHEFFEGAKRLRKDVRCLEGVVGPPLVNRKEMLGRLGISDAGGKPVIGITGGSRGAIYHVVERLLDEYMNNPPQDYHVVLDKNTNNRLPVFQAGKEVDKERWISWDKRPNFIEQCVAYDLVFIKSGGGSMNGVCANRTPCVCITEPLQPQLNAIAYSAERNEYARIVSLEDFDKDPLGIIQREIEKKSENEELRKNLGMLEKNAEMRLVGEIYSEFLSWRKS